MFNKFIEDSKVKYNTLEGSLLKLVIINPFNGGRNFIELAVIKDGSEIEPAFINFKNDLKARTGTVLKPTSITMMNAEDSKVIELVADISSFFGEENVDN